MQPQTPFYRPPLTKAVRVNTAHVGQNYEYISKATNAMRDYVAQGAQTTESLATLRPERKYDTMVVARSAHSAPSLSRSTSGGYFESDPASTSQQLAIESHALSAPDTSNHGSDSKRKAMARPVDLSRSFRRLEFPWKSQGTKIVGSQEESSGLILQATSPGRRAAAMVKELPSVPMPNQPEPVEPVLIPNRLLLATQVEQERLALCEIKAEAARRPRQSACFLSQSKRTDFSRDPTGLSDESGAPKSGPAKCSRTRDDDINASCSFPSPNLRGRDSVGHTSPLRTQAMESQRWIPAEASRSVIGANQQARRSAMPARMAQSISSSGSRIHSKRHSGRPVTRRDYTFGAAAFTATMSARSEDLSQHHFETDGITQDDDGDSHAADDSASSIHLPQQTFNHTTELQPITHVSSATSVAAYNFFDAPPGSSGQLGNCSQFVEAWQREHGLYTPSRPHTATGASGETKRFRSFTRTPVLRASDRRASLQQSHSRPNAP